MTKSILLIRFPKNVPIQQLERFYEQVTDKMKDDYHVLAVVEKTTEDLRLEVFNSSEAQEADIEQLKAEIKESFNTLENTEN